MAPCKIPSQMRKTIQSYITFTRRERLGIFCLCGLLVVFLVIRVGLQYTVKQPQEWGIDTQSMQQAWASYNRSDAAKPRKQPIKWPAYQDSDDGSGIMLPDSVNINSADSETLVRFRGIGPATVRRILKYRAEKGQFTNIEQLREMGSFYDTVFVLLQQHLYVGKTVTKQVIGAGRQLQ